MVAISPKYTPEELEKLANFFKLQSHFHSSHPQTEMIRTSFCALIFNKTEPLF